MAPLERSVSCFAIFDGLIEACPRQDDKKTRTDAGY